MVGKGILVGIRLSALLALLIVLPTTAGWIVVYVLGGIVLLVGGLCCCASLCCCSDCDCGIPDCDCPDCDCDCDGCDCDCDPGCDGCDCDCDPGCGDCDCATHQPDEPLASMALPLMAWGVPRARAAWLDRRLAHHPASARYEADVYRFGAWRLCIGCTTVYPVFLLASAFLVFQAPVLPLWAWFGLGAPMAALQGVSSLGLAATRWRKAGVKTGLGVGLALLVHGILVAPWAHAWQVTALVGLLGLAALSAIPRTRRMQCQGCEKLH